MEPYVLRRGKRGKRDNREGKLSTDLIKSMALSVDLLCSVCRPFFNMDGIALKGLHLLKD